MSILKNIFSKKEKALSADGITGGMELLKRLTSGNLSTTNMLETYRTSLYVFACISAIATKTASIDYQLYKILNSNGDTKEIVTHPLLDLLYKPNAFQTKMEFTEITIINLKCTGEAFWYKVRNSGGKVVELLNLRPDFMTVVLGSTTYILGYKFRKSDGSEVFFAPEEIIHIKYPDSISQSRGMAPLHPASKRVQTEDYANNWQRNFFLNSARPDAVFKNPGKKMNDAQKKDFRDGWNKLFRGVGKNSNIAILEGGMEYQIISLSQKEMDFIESMKFTRDDILTAFHVPKSIVAITDDVNRANAETAMFIFLSETIKPEITRIVEKINEQLVYIDFAEDFYIDFSDPTPANRELQLKEYSEGLSSKYLLINEVRAREGLPPVRGGWSFYGTLMDVPIGGLSASDAKSIVETIEKQSDANMELIKKHSMLNKKQYSFKGRYQLKQKFLMFEEMKKNIETLEKSALDMKKKAAEKPKKKKGFVAIFNTVELKKIYADMINKKIDERGARLKDATNDFFAGQMHRVLGNLSTKKSKTVIKKLDAAAILKYDKEVGLSIKFITPYIEQYLKDSALESLNIIAPQEDFHMTEAIQKKIEARAKLFAEAVNSTTLEKLDATLAEGISASEGIADLTARVEQVYSDFPIYRSEMIARTEATVANNEGNLEGFRQSEVATGKEWINAGDSRVRDEHLDVSEGGVSGEIIALDANFSNGLSYPSEPNCRCVIGPAFLEG
jgi:HK97 family phage portal protein